jgi:hypothetical protein
MEFSVAFLTVYQLTLTKVFQAKISLLAHLSDTT